ncbi:MAG: DUF4190 domain-containing protein [Planctomycetaceae bacterium]|nr:DUF4190 domain-containing protein [Planctomycetaceae bacterium]
MARYVDDDEFDDDDYEDEPRGDSTGGLIPYKNPAALAAYYCGLFSLFPLLGLILGIAGVVLGIMGLKHRARHPETKGAVHAYIGIVMGGFFTLVWGAFLILMIVAMAAEAGR